MESEEGNVMDDMYNNSENQEQGSYGGSQYQQPQSSIQSQLQYQYQPAQDNLEEPMSMGEWMISMLVMLIPCVNIVMMFVWAFSSTEKKSKSNFFKAYLIFFAIMMVFSIVMMIVMSAAMVGVMESLESNYYYY